MFLKLTIKTSEQCHWHHSSMTSFRYLFCWRWIYFTPCSSVSIVNFDQVNTSWAILKLHLSCDKDHNAPQLKNFLLDLGKKPMHLNLAHYRHYLNKKSLLQDVSLISCSLKSIDKNWGNQMHFLLRSKNNNESINIPRLYQICFFQVCSKNVTSHNLVFQ